MGKTRVVYAATSVTKEVSDWHPDDGAGTERWTTISEDINLRAATFKGLLARLAAEYFLTLDDVYVSGEDEAVEWFDYSRVETDDGDEPDEDEIQRCREGDLKLFCCDYSFTVERRTVGPVPRARLVKEGVKFH